MSCHREWPSACVVSREYDVLSLLGAAYLEKLFSLRLDGWQVGIHAGHSLHNTSLNKLRASGWDCTIDTTCTVK